MGSRRRRAAAMILLVTAAGCSSYRYHAGDLEPLGEALQGPGRAVADDGTVTYTQGRLEISLRPVTTQELDRQFLSHSRQGPNSTNPYTFGDSKVFRTGETPQRFTVFRLRVENYEYPKVHLDPARVYLTTSNGRKYHALSYEQLYVYYRRYTGGGKGGVQAGIPGNEFSRWRSRIDLLRQTMFPDQVIFSAQEREGYVVFESLAPDVSRVTVHVPDVVVRFDYKDDATQTTTVTARFERQIGRRYADGTIELQEPSSP